MKILSARELSIDIDDLEYPFMLYKLGEYYQAYQIYNKILPSAWKNQKYILYFICLYNIWSIRYGVQYQLMSRRDVDESAIFEKISRINLNEVLNKLPIDEEIRKIFQDLLSYREIGQQAIAAERLNNKIHQQRKLCERGGSSINGNLLELLGRFEREYSFCNDNFIVYDNNQYYNSICLNSAAGILNSYATPNSPRHSSFVFNSKIDTILPIGIFIFIFQLTNSELKELFKQYEIYSIKLSEAAVEKINAYLSNLNEAKDISYSNHISEIIQNLFYVISKSENDSISTVLLYGVLLKYWNALQAFQFNENTLNELLMKHKPSSETLCQLLDVLIKRMDETSAFAEIIYTISNYLHQDKCCYTTFSMSCIQSNQNANSIYSLYNVIKDDMRPFFSNFCMNNITDVVAYLNFIVLNKLPVESIEKFKEMLSKLDLTNAANIAYCCHLLAMMYSDKQYKNLRTIIKDYSRNNECLKFFLSPSTYNRINDVQVLWITLLDEASQKELMIDTRYRDIIKGFLKREYLTPWKKNRYIDLL